MDCHYPLRHRVHWLASLQRPARTAAASAGCGNARRVARRGIDRNSPIGFGYSGSGRERDAVAGRVPSGVHREIGDAQQFRC